MWRDPKKSGMVFGGATLVFLFFAFLKMPLIALVCYTIATALTLVTLWARFGKTVGKCDPCALQFSSARTCACGLVSWRAAFRMSTKTSGTRCCTI